MLVTNLDREVGDGASEDEAMELVVEAVPLTAPSRPLLTPNAAPVPSAHQPVGRQRSVAEPTDPPPRGTNHLGERSVPANEGP